MTTGCRAWSERQTAANTAKGQQTFSAMEAGKDVPEFTYDME
jgi:hypothetical protein